MELEHRINAFVQLGNTIEHLLNEEWNNYNGGITEKEYQDFNHIINNYYTYNAWFTPNNIRQALTAIRTMLKENNLKEWIKQEELEDTRTAKNIAVIMAGNIPLVGFHDFLSVLISGNKVFCKLSSDDNQLLPALSKLLFNIKPEFEDRIHFITQFKDISFDAIIATGSDNSSRYFEYYFGKYPHIIRKNRTSVAILDGNETEDDLFKLSQDIFQYFGLGCRSITKIYVPKGYDFDKIFNAVYPLHPIINHNKYANNYDYHKAIYLMNQISLLENGFMLLKEDQDLHSPISVLFYEYYDSKDELIKNLPKEEIQCIVSSEHIPFGKAQFPDLWDYADGVNTIQFLKGV